MMQEWLQTRTYGQMILLGVGLTFLSFLLASLTKMAYLANIGLAATAVLVALFPQMPGRSILSKREVRLIRPVCLLALLIFLFVYHYHS
ncbi:MULTISPECIES: hypothetical protein [unclassified Streptococcus]|uniref:hypothetical protein n=1 Tax=unclassified Streptococcus TaxID=2608887 RepID=UPI00374D6079